MLASATVVLYSPRIIVPKLINEDPEAKLIRLESVLSALLDDLDIILSLLESIAEEYQDILGTHRMFV